MDQPDATTTTGLEVQKGNEEEKSKKKSKKKKREGSSSSDSTSARRKKRKKQFKTGISNFSSFDSTGANYSGKTYEEKTAEEKLHELLHGPMTETQRDLKARYDAKMAQQAAGSANKGGGKGKSPGANCVRPQPVPQPKSTPLIQEVNPSPASSTPVNLKSGDAVMVHGLQSETGKKLNGKTAVITKYVEETGRFMVEMTKGMSSFHSLKRENLAPIAKQAAM
eukprot:gnl/TRDRNA2_/TRDRNA2_45665_c0_seq1.p1 gnl/TRDRNA2_/TRDRNA2_45665_c0~~gnl/TRDRNA2_/TRDRNA2_45665_c0_seq1.p1  ORF type:complete len:223 (-),score=46.11 gnl/TRDRNA2_/TRDRNA2_45665_c0_seq1:175-843(-)